MKNWKKIAVGLSTAALVLGSVLPALAAAETSNTDITDHSYANVQAYDHDVLVESNTTSDTTFENLDLALANTGFNSQKDNEDDNSMSTSSASADWETANFANVNETTLGEGGGARASNDGVSDHSGDWPQYAPGPVTAVANDGDYYAVINSNSKTNIKNWTISIANTGLNSQSGNEDKNSMVAGSASSYAGAGNVVNSNVTSIGGGSGSAEASNTDITDHSYANAQAYDNDEVTVSNSNSKTNVTNVTAAVANSGGNRQNNNEDKNSMTTGTTGAEAVSGNYVNVNDTTVANGGGSAKASNDNVDDHSQATAVATDNDHVSVTNSNSGTTVNNTSVAVANSGGNSQNKNEDGNSMTTGGATASGRTTNVVNANQTEVK